MEMFCGKPYYTQSVGFLGKPNNPQSMVNPKSETLGILCEKLMKIYSHAMGFDQKSLNLKTHTVLRYGKLIPMDFPMYGNIFTQLVEKRWEYPYLFHPWILRDFSCVKLTKVFIFNQNEK